ncbi:MAG: UDP-N-acetylmuramoyl-tripeptide--D-alanyl-D-alanine ligase [Muribaculum sp.]|nr:UDP-N-acetylmuramoyl-tripeptide--D-alanyl-D-alanine ligase [Muribaculum sp.]
MGILTYSLLIALLAVGSANIGLELRRDLMMLQQNSYRNERYMRWLRTSADTTSYIRLCSYIALLVMMAPQLSERFRCAVALVVLLINIFNLCTATYKKPLVWTPRAKRIYTTAAVLTIGLVMAVWLCTRSLMWTGTMLMLAYAASHIILMTANWLLKPVEAKINKGYYDDAARILRTMPDMTVIGITGSYGKTSTKHYLNRILSEQFNVLMTPGSYNTLMGVIRTVREMMQPYTEIFICEMGAKNIGDIKEICDLVHPKIGIITAVGEQHLESFKTIENVQRTKFELADALPSDGTIYVNNDFPYAASRRVDNAECVRYAINGTEVTDFWVTEMKFHENGTDFTLHTPKGEAQFTTRLIGEFNISNLIPAIAVAMQLGMPLDKISHAVSRIEQVEHRLSMKRTPGGITIIDDAFNSNPDGSRMALDVLASMTKGKRIIVTPGMIELGEKQYDYNNRLGRKIASSADVAIIVGAYNRDAILSGLKEAGMPEENVRAVETFKEAQAVLSTIMRQGDTVLYENDLPDTFK